jgi:hypothetical protein
MSNRDSTSTGALGKLPGRRVEVRVSGILVILHTISERGKGRGLSTQLLPCHGWKAHVPLGAEE